MYELAWTALNCFLIIWAVHWVADFVMQSHWMSQYKSTQWDAFAAHIITYGIVFTIGSIFAIYYSFFDYLTPENVKFIMVFVAINIGLHALTDAITSRITTTLYKANDFHNFFVVVGFDQLVHAATIGITLELIIGRTFW